MFFKKSISDIKKFLRKTISFCKKDKLKYFVKITDIYMDEKNYHTMVRYLITSCGTIGSLSVFDFIHSPLIYGVHPKQMYDLGQKDGQYLIKVAPRDTIINQFKISNELRKFFH